MSFELSKIEEFSQRAEHKNLFSLDPLLIRPALSTAYDYLLFEPEIEIHQSKFGEQLITYAGVNTTPSHTLVYGLHIYEVGEFSDKAIFTERHISKVQEFYRVSRLYRVWVLSVLESLKVETSIILDSMGDDTGIDIINFLIFSLYKFGPVQHISGDSCFTQFDEINALNEIGFDTSIFRKFRLKKDTFSPIEVINRALYDFEYSSKKAYL